MISAGENAYKAATLSDQDVKKYAHAMAAQLDKENKIAPAGSAYFKRLAKIVARHKKEDGLDLNYKVYLEPEVNAFSLADGTVRVYSGLMDKMTDDELLFVIGHEVGHVKSGHSKARLQRAYAASAAVDAIGTGLNAATPATAGGIGVAIRGDLLASLVSEVVKAQFSQSDETESDEYGLHMLHKNGRSPQASVQALLKLGDDAGGGSEGSLLNQFTSSHPDPLSRAEHIKELIPTLGAAGKVVAQKEERTASPEQVALIHDNSTETAPSHSETAPAPTLPSASEIAFADIPEPAAGSKPTVEVAQSERTGAAAKHGTWFVQVGAYANPEHADKVQADLNAKKLPVVVDRASGKRKDLITVRVGPFPTRGDAAVEAAELQTVSGESSGAFVVQVRSL